MHRLRIDVEYDLRPTIEKAIKDILSTTDYIYAGCINCEHFNEMQELCKLANQRPPIKVILFGCPKWEFNGIPF